MQIEKTIRISAGAAEVWEALTNPRLTQQYFFDCETISDWQVGSPVNFQTNVDGLETIHVTGIVKQADSPFRLEHTCVAAEYEGVPEKTTTVSYRLRPLGNETELTVTQGEINDTESLQQHHSSWDHVLAGLKSLLERGPSG